MESIEKNDDTKSKDATISDMDINEYMKDFTRLGKFQIPQ